MVLHHLQPCFTGGEVSPSLYARVDSAAYRTWLKSAKNCFIQPQGGVSNRAGTRYMGQAKFTASPCRLIPFVISEEEAYALEMGKNYVRFYAAGGLILDGNGDPYELATPYGADELEKVAFAQHDHVLFFTHPDHAPCRLTRTAAGVFAWEEVPVKYGPFAVSNKDDTKKMRVVNEPGEVISQGVSATLTFQPLVYPDMMVWGYFNNEWFYAGEYFGFDLAAFVQVFNTAFAARGVTAQNLGGLIKLTSDAATGGDWNGKQLVIAYRRSFSGEPELSVTQTLSGGSNAGAVIPEEENRYFLESDFDAFTPAQVGGRFSLTHQVAAQYLAGTLGYENVSDAIYSAGDFTLRTGGTWTGQIQVEVSRDLGETWKVQQVLSRTQDDDNFYVSGDLSDGETLLCVRLRALQITGEAGFELQADAFLQEGIVKVLGFVSARKLLVGVERPFGSSAWTEHWAEGSFSPAAGYPACVFFYQDRLGFAATYREPQGIWFSKTGAYTDFGHARNTLLDSDALGINLSGNRLNAVRAVAVANRLLVFTAGSEWTLHAQGAFTPHNIHAEQHSERGCGPVAPVMVGNKALFVQARGSILRNFYYDYTASAYTGEDLTICAKHLFARHSIKEICYQQEPDNLVWCVLDNGTLLCLTYLPEQGICAWTHHETDGEFVSLCTLPEKGCDTLWCAVHRNGVYLIERQVRRMASQAPEEQVFMDAAVSLYSPTPVSEMDGLGHLEGREVAVLGDGNPVYGLKVSDGKITLPRPMSRVHAGLAYQTEIVTLPLYYERKDGTAADRKKRLVSVLLSVQDSRGGYVGTDTEHLDEIVQRGREPFNAPMALKTQCYEIALRGEHTLTPSLVIRQKDPLPLTLLACVLRAV